ncbi:MAG TPA: AEC family transporter [Crenalkalicoccus sp.]|nr:AEC family transporter [Crenalkalicoccus sp.]
MAGFVLLCLPIFGVIGLGWACTAFRLMPAATIAAVGHFAFQVALPALLLRLMAAQPLSENFEPAFFTGYLACCLTVFFGTLALARPWQRRGHAAALAAAAAMGNVGYLGPPLLLPLLGPRSGGPVAMAIMSEVAVVLAIGTVLMAPADPGAGLRAALRTLRAVALNPVLLAIAAGAACGALALPFPDPLDRFLAFLGGSAGPTALFALGGTLGLLRLDRRLLASAAALAVAKLVVYPLLVWLLLGRVLGLDPFWVQAAVLLAAMPTASNAFVLASRNGTAEREVSAAVLLSTVAAAALFPLTAWLVIR